MTTRTKFKTGDRIIYVGGSKPLNGKVLMPNGAVPSEAPSYSIQIDNDLTVYTVEEKTLRPLMSDPSLAWKIEKALARAEQSLAEARYQFKEARKLKEEDGQPDYELGMLDEWEIVIKNTLRFEISSERARWADITAERSKK